MIKLTRVSLDWNKDKGRYYNILDDIWIAPEHIVYISEHKHLDDDVDGTPPHTHIVAISDVSFSVRETMDEVIRKLAEIKE